jgi:hypothetical protein
MLNEADIFKHDSKALQLPIRRFLKGGYLYIIPCQLLLSEVMGGLPQCRLSIWTSLESDLLTMHVRSCLPRCNACAQLRLLRGQCAQDTVPRRRSAYRCLVDSHRLPDEVVDYSV